MKESKHEINPDAKVWQKSPGKNLVRYIPSGIYFARFKIRGKLVRKSLKTDVLSVAKLRLRDLEIAENKTASKGELASQSRATFADAIATYRENGFRPVEPRSKKDAQKLKPLALAYYENRLAALLKSWPGLEKMEVRRLTDQDCQNWANRYRKEYAPSAFNHTLGILSNLIAFGIKAGFRYDNPAKNVMRETEKPKSLELPSVEQFNAFVSEIENHNNLSGAKPCAELVQFMAFSGFRIGEAAYVTWADCDLERGQIIARGHPETGLKGRNPGETRIVPMIPEMRKLLEQMRAQRKDEPETAGVMRVQECQGAMNRAAKKIGMKRITHHDLRHLFATRCIESGVDIPTVARWMGHKDGGALAMRVYGHLRDQHSTDMAARVTFRKPAPDNVVELPRKEVA